MRILVLGAGAIGGYFGGRLAEAGADVTFLVRPKRREQIARDGLRIESPLGDARLEVRTVEAGEVRPDYDLVLFTCKAYDLDSAMEAIAPAMGARPDGRSCAVLPLLNGIAHLERLDARFGAASVMGGTCQINATLRRDGVIVHGDSLQRVLFGERDGSRSARAQALAAAFAATKIAWKLSDDIVQDLWDKIVFLCALATTTCLFRANVREIVAAPGGREAMERALEANAEIARREGHPPGAEMLAFARARLTDSAGLWSASMLRDLESGGRVEADHVVGWMLERARARGVDDSLLSLAYTHLKAYEARRAAGRLPTELPDGARAHHRETSR
ncbi:MAG TPA: 2-dehydropantoate 2-reductase [Usitatibacter sp.]|nr:2-dehydropantoate 2-reductase [Usitatibacter sp.]